MNIHVFTNFLKLKKKMFMAILKNSKRPFNADQRAVIKRKFHTFGVSKYFRPVNLPPKFYGPFPPQPPKFSFCLLAEGYFGEYLNWYGN